MSELSIDINCDLGESFGNYKIGNDADIFPHISSCNIACGFHGGDPFHIEKTIEKAILHNVTIGAHPSYPDLQGFGRRKMTLSGPELKALIKYQVSALKGMSESKGAAIKYVKPHGALYNSISSNIEEAKYVIEAILEIDDTLKLMCLAGSELARYATTNNIEIITEAFADRKYADNGMLMSRSIEGSVISDPTVAANQVLDIVINKQVITNSGSKLSLDANSICIHGDNISAVSILANIRDSLAERNIQIKSFIR